MRIPLTLALALALPSLALAQQWGDLEGTFVFKGTPPAPAKIIPNKDEQFCGKHNLVDEKVVVNPQGGGIANIVIYLSKTPASVHPDYAADAKKEVVIDNENCRFTPHIGAVRTGQPLVIGNKDPVGHNTKADFFNNTPFNDLIPSGGKITKTFSATETTPSPLSCNIHPWMTGYVLIRDNPYFAVTDQNGKFTIRNLPAGDHEFIVWHETGYLSSVTLGGKATTWARGRAKISIKPGANSLGKVEAAPVPK